MLKPPMGSINDTFDFVKNLWGGMKIPGIPGMVMPTLSIEELNKQIADLKAVESWLNVNMSMLRNTIQALEVQAATISTLKSMGESFSAAVKPAAKPDSSQSTFKPQPNASTSSAETTESASENQTANETSSAADTELNPPAIPITMPNPAVWWNMLQEQFAQAVNSALPADTNAADAPSTTPAAPATSAATPASDSAPVRKRKSPPKH